MIDALEVAKTAPPPSARIAAIVQASVFRSCSCRRSSSTDGSAA